MTCYRPGKLDGRPGELATGQAPDTRPDDRIVRDTTDTHDGR